MTAKSKPKRKSKPKHPFTHLILRITYDPALRAALRDDKKFSQNLDKHLEPHEVFKLTATQKKALSGKNSDAINQEIDKEFGGGEELHEMVRPQPNYWPVN